MVKFSVITPSWNQGRYLSACIESVLAQEDPDFEHLVLDNCSTDETASVARKFPHLTFLSEPDRGQSHAVNKGFLKARGEIICWLNSDDMYQPGLFKRLRGEFSHPGSDVLFGDVLQIGYGKLPDQRAPARFENRLDMIRWWSSRVRLHQPAVFFRREVRKATGLLREDLHYAMDYEYWWRMSEHSVFRQIPEVLAVQHRQPDSKTVLAWQKVHEERERIFSPLYGLVDGGDRRGLLREKSRAMASRYLGEAFAAAPSEPTAALKLLAASFGQSPCSFLHPRWLGVLKRMALRKPGSHI